MLQFEIKNIDTFPKHIREIIKYEIKWRLSDENMHIIRSIDFVNLFEPAKMYEMYLALYSGECFEMALNKGDSHELLRK